MDDAFLYAKQKLLAALDRIDERLAEPSPASQAEWMDLADETSLWCRALGIEPPPETASVMHIAIRKVVMVFIGPLLHVGPRSAA